MFSSLGILFIHIVTYLFCSPFDIEHMFYINSRILRHSARSTNNVLEGCSGGAGDRGKRGSDCRCEPKGSNSTALVCEDALGKARSCHTGTLFTRYRKRPGLFQRRRVTSARFKCHCTGFSQRASSPSTAGARVALAQRFSAL